MVFAKSSIIDVWPSPKYASDVGTHCRPFSDCIYIWNWFEMNIFLKKETYSGLASGDTAQSWSFPLRISFFSLKILMENFIFCAATFIGNIDYILRKLLLYFHAFHAVRCFSHHVFLLSSISVFYLSTLTVYEELNLLGTKKYKDLCEFS